MFCIPPLALECVKKLNRAGFEAWIVGGAVRDCLAGRTPADADITTSALPGQILQVFDGYSVHTPGIAHGTVGVSADGESAEITSYRTDGHYSDGRHPDSVSFTAGLEQDCARRDFTVNAICWHPQLGLRDFYGGEEDLKNGILRCIGRPEVRFEEDGLRVLRALRFCSVLGLKARDETRRAIFSCRHLLKNISAERLYSELLKLLCGENVRQVLTEYGPVLAAFIPEIEPMIGLDQRNPHHVYDVWEHTAAAVAACPPVPLLRLAALLHDTGKPDTFTVDEAGVGHFRGHGEASRRHCECILDRLKAPSEDRRLVYRLVKYHDTLIEPTEKRVRRRLNKHGEKALRLLLLLKRADNKAQNTVDFDRSEEYDRLERVIDRVLEEKQCFSLKDLEINGDDLLAMGWRPGPSVGSALKSALEQVMDGNVENSRLRLTEYVKKLQ